MRPLLSTCNSNISNPETKVKSNLHDPLVEFVPVSCLTAKYQKNIKINDLPQWEFWQLPGHGIQKASCGQVAKVLACAGPAHHDKKLIFHTCDDPECPVCFERWSSREAKHASERLKQAQKLYHYKPVRHWIVSPPQDKYDLTTEAGYKQLRKDLLQVLKLAGFVGGMIIFHPYRLPDDDNTKEMRWGPHFHLLTFGHAIKSSILYKLTGWIIKNKGIRYSVSGTIRYELSHAGIWQGKRISSRQGKDVAVRSLHTITWFGSLSYNKVVVGAVLTSIEVVKCKICGEPLHEYKFDIVADGINVLYERDVGVVKDGVILPYSYEQKHKIYKLKIEEPQIDWFKVFIIHKRKHKNKNDKNVSMQQKCEQYALL